MGSDGLAHQAKGTRGRGSQEHSRKEEDEDAEAVGLVEAMVTL